MAAVNTSNAEAPAVAVTSPAAPAAAASAATGAAAGTAKQWWEPGYVPAPKAEAPVAPVEVSAPPAEEPAAPVEVVAPKVEAPVAPVEVAAPKVEKPMPEKVSMPLNVKFDTAKSDIKKKYDNDINKVADFMKANPAATAVIEGHTDNVDKFNNPDNNMKLSQARADSVRQYLIDNFGIDASRITAVGYGPNKPIAGNDTAEGRNKNRRVEAVIEMMKTK
jgi:OOP family OmpA-OmpF porin